jgi:hypothetical protein
VGAGQQQFVFLHTKKTVQQKGRGRACENLSFAFVWDAFAYHWRMVFQNVEGCEQGILGS